MIAFLDHLFDSLYFTASYPTSALSHLTFDEVDSVSEIGVQSHSIFPSHGFSPMQSVPENVSSGLTMASGGGGIIPNSINAAVSSGHIFAYMPSTNQDCSGSNFSTSVGQSFNASFGPSMLFNATGPNSSHPMIDGSPTSMVSKANGMLTMPVPMQVPVRLSRNPIPNDSTFIGLQSHQQQQPMGHGPTNGDSSVTATARMHQHHAVGHLEQQQQLIVGRITSSTSSSSTSSSATGGRRSSGGTSSSSTTSSGITSKGGPEQSTRRSNHRHSNKPLCPSNELDTRIDNINPPLGPRNPSAPSVHSASGASSASSTSRQNGTGASATGSGTTMASADRVCRSTDLSNSPFGGLSELPCARVTNNNQPTLSCPRVDLNSDAVSIVMSSLSDLNTKKAPLSHTHTLANLPVRR